MLRRDGGRISNSGGLKFFLCTVKGADGTAWKGWPGIVVPPRDDIIPVERRVLYRLTFSSSELLKYSDARGEPGDLFALRGDKRICL
ncbi:hypothetical protein GWI33_003973 [Rhynchophorus ferrugineus]|uniref:Uncharacterized protein n=1 Tax=Rhynchophorus ferrugineus TaxID=354439 RepID=A0A834MF06_RHYFE|nr:hypothetical protein GWI33_003973 [Rhynchophorus ferrugineus]